MKITVRFTNNDSRDYPCAAIVELPWGSTVCAVCKTWDEAASEVKEKVRAALSVGVPPTPQELDIDL